MNPGLLDNGNENQMVKSKIKRSKLAMDEQRSTTFMVDPDKLVVIGWDTKHKSKIEHPLFQARALEAIDEVLALNIANQGFLSVISVRVDGDKYEVDAGRRRAKAARRANEIRRERAKASGEDFIPVKVECKVVKGSTLVHVGLMISENANRKDVEPMQMAEDLADFIRLGASEEMAAAAGGKTVPALRQFLKLLDLDPKVQETVSSGALSVKAAIQLAAFGREEQVAELKKITAGEIGSTVADVEARVRSKKSGEDVSKAPGRRLINKLLESDEGKRVLSAADGVQVVRWMLGELNARNVKGLVEAIRSVEGGNK
jgi:ParB-like chromosome segregation protein Spo0J